MINDLHFTDYPYDICSRAAQLVFFSFINLCFGKQLKVISWHIDALPHARSGALYQALIINRYDDYHVSFGQCDESSLFPMFAGKSTFTTEGSCEYKVTG